MLTKRCYIPHASRQLAQENTKSKSRQLSYSNASRCGFINKQTRLTMEHALAVAAETKSIIGKLRNAWSYHVQVLCTNKLPLHFRKFSQQESFDWNLTLWHLGGFGDFRKKNRLNACVFAQEFIRSGMLYRPGKSLKRCGKSSSLNSKKMFCLGVWVFSEWHHKWRTFWPPWPTCLALGANC